MSQLLLRRRRENASNSPSTSGGNLLGDMHQLSSVPSNNEQPGEASQSGPRLFPQYDNRSSPKASAAAFDLLDPDCGDSVNPLLSSQVLSNSMSMSEGSPMKVLGEPPSPSPPKANRPYESSPRTPKSQSSLSPGPSPGVAYLPPCTRALARSSSASLEPVKKEQLTPQARDLCDQGIQVVFR